jgi:hypothetical protein
VAVAGRKEQVAAPPQPPPPTRGRRPFRDNTRLILFGIFILLAVLAGLLTLAARSARLAPDFLTEFVLYALSATNLTILVALVFVLARNIVSCSSSAARPAVRAVPRRSSSPCCSA